MTRPGWCCMRGGCKSTHEHDGGADRILRGGSRRRRAARARRKTSLPRAEASIVPANSISGRALLAVIAIMTFLAALTLGAVVLVRSAAGEWQSAVAREITIQVRPSEQRDVEADVRNAVALASGTPGVAGVRAYTQGGIRAACWSHGSAAGLRSTNCRSRA